MKILICFILLCQVFTGFGERTKKKIYFEVDTKGRAPCFKRLNGTHQIGCTSEPNGNVGVVHYINTTDDIDWLIEKAEPNGNVGVVHYINTTDDIDWLIEKGPHKPYAVLLNAEYFNGNVVHRLRASGKINGIMVIHIEDNENSTLSPTPEAFSADKSCPNDRYGLYGGSEKYGNCAKVKWNPPGDGLMFEDYGFPIFILTKEIDVQFAIENCYERFNQPDASGNAKTYPLCAVQLKDRMDGAKDSKTCIRRTRHQINLNPDRYCDPMGDMNVYSTIKEMNSSTERPPKSVIIAAARMDSFSMFENYYPSADNHVSGIVAMLAIAEAFGKVKEDIHESTSKDVMFTFFQGEAFDYIGSGRMVYDMEHNNFPLRLSNHVPLSNHVQTINLSHIASFVEVNQLAYRDDGKIWVHTDPITRPNVSTEISDMIKDLETIGEGLIGESNQEWPLPPASVQTFLKNRADIPAVVITDHRKEYTNKYYNSRFDLAEQIKQSYPEGFNDSQKYDYVTEQAKNLTEAATVLAKFLYKQATNKNASDDFAVNETTVSHLLYCYLISPNCKMLKEVLDKDNAEKLAKKPYPYYVGVDSTTNEFTIITKNLLLSFLGDKDSTAKTKDNCTKKSDGAFHRFVWMQGPKDVNGTRHPFCMKGLANFSVAVSIVFDLDYDIDGYDFKSGKFSTWTESSWATDAMDVRFFLIPSKQFETTTLAVGVVVMLVSMVIVYFIDSRTDILFAHPGPSLRH